MKEQKRKPDLQVTSDAVDSEGRIWGSHECEEGRSAPLVVVGNLVLHVATPPPRHRLSIFRNNRAPLGMHSCLRLDILVWFVFWKLCSSGRVPSISTFEGLIVGSGVLNVKK